MAPNPLAAWIARNPNINQNQLAKRLGYSRSYVGQIVTQGRPPSYEFAAALAELTCDGVPIASWHDHWMSRGKRGPKPRGIAKAS